MRIPEHKFGHRIHEGPLAVARATPKQRQSYDRLRKRCSVRGVVLLSNGVLRVGFRRITGRNVEAYIGRRGERLATENIRR